MDPSGTTSTSLSAELYAELAALYEQTNRTELYQLCKRSGYNIHPAATREQLISTLLTGQGQQNNPIDEVRNTLMRLITEYWSSLVAQLKCPAQHMYDQDERTRIARPCFGCTDMQVLYCVTEQVPDHQRRIYQLRKK